MDSSQNLTRCASNNALLDAHDGFYNISRLQCFFETKTKGVGVFSFVFPFLSPLYIGTVTCCYVLKHQNCATFRHDKTGMQCKHFIITMCFCSFGPSFRYLNSQIIKYILFTCQKVISKTSTFSHPKYQKNMHF